MNNPNLLNDGGERPRPRSRPTLEDLLKAYTMQLFITEATIDCLEQALADKQRLAYQDIELERLQRLQVAWEIEQLTKGNE